MTYCIIDYITIHGVFKDFKNKSKMINYFSIVQDSFQKEKQNIGQEVHDFENVGWYEEGYVHYMWVNCFHIDFHIATQKFSRVCHKKQNISNKNSYSIEDGQRWTEVKNDCKSSFLDSQPNKLVQHTEEMNEIQQLSII